MTFSISNLDKIGSERSTFSLKDICELYLPCKGLAAAITEHLARSVVTMPALEIEIDCCYMAS